MVSAEWKISLYFMTCFVIVARPETNGLRTKCQISKFYMLTPLILIATETSSQIKFPMFPQNGGSSYKVLAYMYYKWSDDLTLRCLTPWSYNTKDALRSSSLEYS